MLFANNIQLMRKRSHTTSLGRKMANRYSKLLECDLNVEKETW